MNSRKLKITRWTIPLVLLTACSSRHALVQVADIQLSAPAVQVESIFFAYETGITVAPPPEGCQIHYTVDGTVPDAESPVFGAGVKQRTTGSFSFRAFGAGYLPSPVMTTSVFKVRPTGLLWAQGNTPSSPYDTAPATILTDRRKGSRDFRSGEWWGYRAEVVTLEFGLDNTVLNGVALSFLEDQGSWIFGPQAVRADFYDAVGNHLSGVVRTYEAATSKAGSNFRFLILNTTPLNATRIRLEITSLKALPEWHPGAGNVPWLFIDEILVL